MSTKSLALAIAMSLACLAPVRSQIKAFSASEDRKAERVFYYTQDATGFHSRGQLSIDYGSPTWNKSYDDEKAFDRRTRGHRWRFGSGPWTRLDTNLALRIGGVDVAPGSYYLVVERTESDVANLILLDPDTIRKQKLDASQADETGGGTAIELAWRRDGPPAAKMTIALRADDKDPRQVELVVRFGPHELKAQITAEVEGR